MPKKPSNNTAPIADDKPSNSTDTRNSRTDLEISETSEEALGIRVDEGEIPASLQTGTKIMEDGSGSAVQRSLPPDISPDSQTGTETVKILAEGTIPDGDGCLKTPDTQTDTGFNIRNEGPADESGSRPGRRNTKSQSGTTAKTSPRTESDTDNTPSSTRRRRTRTESVLSIDDERTVKTSEERIRSDLLDLVESQKSRKILSGTIQGVERSTDNPNLSFAVIYHGAFKVIIPADETVETPEDFRDRSPSDVMHYLITKRLGAEVDYIVKGIDAKSGVAAASRLEAMAFKRRQYYFGTDRDGNNLLYEDLCAEARIVSVIRAGVFIDLFGLEIYVPLRELSYQRWIDASAHFQPGQRVLVKILRLDRSDRENIKVTASVKQAGDNPYEQALRRYVPGNRYVGTVSVVDTNGVFVSMDGGIDCLCSYPKRGRPPRGSRVTVRIIGVNHDNNRIWGAITHMTTVR